MSLFESIRDCLRPHIAKNHQHEGQAHAWPSLLILTAIVLFWLSLALAPRHWLPEATKWLDVLFGIGISMTYFGVWAIVIVLTRYARRQRCLQSLATTITLFVILVVAEVPALLGLIDWTSVFRTLSGEGFDYRTAYVGDDELGFRRIPNISWSGKPRSDIEEGWGLSRSLTEPITFTYDQWGYRNPPDLNQADVILLGDSYVEGWYVSDDQTVAARLSALLERPIANLGVAGYGSMHELRVLKEEGVRRNASVAAWFFFEGNDLYNDHGFEESVLDAREQSQDKSLNEKALALASHWLDDSFLMNALYRIRLWSQPFIPPRWEPYWAVLSEQTSHGGQRVYFADYGAVPWTDYEVGRWSKARETLEEGVIFAKENDINLFFIYVPTKYRVYRNFIELPPGSPMVSWGVWEELPFAFEEFCTANPVRCIDLTVPFQRAMEQGRMPYAHNDTHWNPEGHLIAASELDALIREAGW